MGRYGVTAKLVYDGGDLYIPEEMGVPRADQLQGTIGERLSELSGRICYDSCGTGRSSPDFHRHILEVGHLSVYEHASMTVRFQLSHTDLSEADVLWACINRPGLWVEMERFSIRFTFNPRVVLDWDRWDVISPDEVTVKRVGRILRYHAEQEWPQIVPCPKPWDSALLAEPSGLSERVELYHPEEKWISVYMSGSRGFSHEQVRHGDRSAISQRSTRFVDESESPWIEHPLEQEYRAQTGDQKLALKGDAVTDTARDYYKNAVETLESWLIKRGVDKFTARKQARGAARGKLGNALETQMIFSASVGQWKRMIRMRCHPAADAEIRAVYVQVLEDILKKSRYAEDFKAFKLVPSPDGMGQCALEDKGV